MEVSYIEPVVSRPVGENRGPPRPVMP